MTMDTTILRKAGLTESQAKGYLTLIEHGSLTPADLAAKTGETRTNAYAIADKLVQLGLAVRTDTGKTTYTPESPSHLKQLLIVKQKQLKVATDELSGLLPQLLSTYRLTTDKPGVIYLEGIDSLHQVYDDIIRTGDTLRIFPSIHDRDDPAIATMIDQQITRQRKAGIKTEVLLRRDIFDAHYNDELFEARPSTFGPLDTQIMVYGPNVALTTFGNGVITTTMTNPMIAQTFRQLFAAQWNLDEPPPSEQAPPSVVNTKND